MKAVTIAQQQSAALALAASIVVCFSSIAASQVLLGLSLLIWLIHRPPLKWPAGAWWAAAFLGLTLLAALLSGDARSALPQVRKLYLWTLLPLGATFLTPTFSRAVLVWPMLLVCAASAIWSFWEYWLKWQAATMAGQDFYLAYVADRITGFMSHWMTFGAHMLIGFCLAGALLLFASPSRLTRIFLLLLLAIFTAAILLGQTRSIWLGLFCSAVVLTVRWRPLALLSLPVLGLVVFLAAPGVVQTRLVSIVRPQGDIDSNSHREITRQVGLRMIAAHPWLGLGPEGPGKNFDAYLPVPRSVRPLPDGYYGHLHNVYLQYAAERGLPALFCFVVFVALNARRWWQAPSPLRQFALATLAGLAASGLFEHNLGDSEVLTPFLALFGIAAREDA
jgi:O-antigen ligase